MANTAAPTVYGDAPVADGAVSEAARVFHVADGAAADAAADALVAGVDAAVCGGDAPLADEAIFCMC